MPEDIKIRPDLTQAWLNDELCLCLFIFTYEGSESNEYRSTVGNANPNAKPIKYYGYTLLS